jgi:hypothetical protein
VMERCLTWGVSLAIVLATIGALAASGSDRAVDFISHDTHTVRCRRDVLRLRGGRGDTEVQNKPAVQRRKRDEERERVVQASILSRLTQKVGGSVSRTPRPAGDAGVASGMAKKTSTAKKKGKIRARKGGEKIEDGGEVFGREFDLLKVVCLAQ